jgi:hypothetical protein
MNNQTEFHIDYVTLPQDFMSDKSYHQAINAGSSNNRAGGASRTSLKVHVISWHSTGTLSRLVSRLLQDSGAIRVT